MKEAARLYGNVAKQISSPRDLEANLLLEAAAKLQAVRDDWSGKRDNLDTALRYNRRLWSVFLSSVTDNGSPLPKEIRQNVANLGIFVMKHTIKTEANPQADKLDVLIRINRELAAGLRAIAP